MPALAEVAARSARGELIVVEVVEFLAVEAVRNDLLIDDARRYPDVVGRLEEQRDALPEASW